MAFPKDTRTMVLVGAGVATVAAIGAAMMFGAATPNDPANVPPAAEGGLKIDLAEPQTLEPTRELRCYVGGQFVGMATLAKCAERNGVATNTLDVGLDSTGALAAAPFTPPPALPVQNAPAPDAGTDATPAPSQQQGGVSGQCLRHVGSEWRQVGQGLSQADCVKALYAGMCIRTPGEAQYGRWNEITLRLVPRRVEVSSDNATFRTYAEQNRQCQFPRL